jgi:hypothetical protein
MIMGQEERSSFLKKSSKKLLFIGVSSRRRACAKVQKFFGSFFQKRTGLFPLALGGLALAPASAIAGPLPISLGSAATFAVLAGSAVTNTGATIVNGNLGVWPNTAVTGFPSGLVVNGGIFAGDETAMQAEGSLNDAYQAAASETGALSLTGLNLGGMNLTPGVYEFSSDAQLTGTLTLNAAGAANAMFIFQIGSTLTTAPGATVQLLNFAAGDEIIWQIGSAATLGADTVFAGDLLALTSISLDTGASISCGGALALNGAVTLQDNAVSTSGSSCGQDSSPVPEPASLSVFLTACLGAAALRQTTRKPRSQGRR